MAEAVEALLPAVLEHAAFFEHLVSLFPPEHYRSGEPHINLRYLPKAVKEQTRREVKEAGRQKKRQKYAEASLEVEGAVPAAPPAARSPTAEPAGDLSLRERLQQRLEAHRRARKADEEAKAGLPKKGAAAADKGGAKQRKRKQGQQDGSKSPGGAAKRKKGAQKGGGKAAGGAPDSEEADVPLQRRAADVGPLQLSSLTGLPGGKNGAGAGKGKGRPPQRRASKAQLLEAARGQQATLKALEGTAQGREAALDSAWSGALNRASGQRVLDDPKLLSRSLKQEAKQKAKRAGAWKERLGRQAKEAADRQAKRRENLQERARQKAVKKGRPVKGPAGGVAKAKAKGPARKGGAGGPGKGKARPGFEGRRGTPTKAKKK